MTREEAEKRAKAIERSIEYNENDESIKYTYELLADAMMEGYQRAMDEVKARIKEKWEHCSFKSGSIVCDELLYEIFGEE